MLLKKISGYHVLVETKVEKSNIVGETKKVLQCVNNYWQRSCQRKSQRVHIKNHFSSSPDKPPTSIFFRFLASRMTTVSLPAVGTYRREKQMSPSFSCCERHIAEGHNSLNSSHEIYIYFLTGCQWGQNKCRGALQIGLLNTASACLFQLFASRTTSRSFWCSYLNLVPWDWFKCS